MSGAPPPVPPGWWRELTDAFGELLRTPLDDSGGRFRSQAACHPLLTRVRDDGPGAAARLSLYHEQYWRRFFVALQEAFPRTAQIMGFFPFNRAVSAVLTAHPPRTRDLSDAAVPFHGALRAALDGLLGAGSTDTFRLVDTPLRRLPGSESAPRAGELSAVLASLEAPWSLLAQALSLDEAERRAFRAPREPIWQPDETELARLSSERPRFAASFSLVRVDYALPWSRHEPASPAAPRTPTPCHLAVVRTEAGTSTRPLDPLFARLLSRARVETVEQALRSVERAATGALAERFRQGRAAYVREAIERGFWVGSAGAAPGE